MASLQKFIRREKKRQRYNKTTNGKKFQKRSSIKLDYDLRRDLLKKSGMNLQRTVEMLVKEYLSR